jgi:hypothetical protein
LDKGWQKNDKTLLRQMRNTTDKRIVLCRKKFITIRKERHDIIPFIGKDSNRQTQTLVVVSLQAIPTRFFARIADRQTGFLYLRK